MSCTTGYVEHAALQVKDINWHIRYFEEVFGMRVIRREESEGKLRQVWLNSGVQLTSSPDFIIARQDGQGVTHLGLLVGDADAAVEESLARGLCPVEGKKNWVRLPDGVALEIKHGADVSVIDALAARSR